jgi:Na+/H+ antiporter NhaD/arsenite permease-like protein
VKSIAVLTIVIVGFVLHTVLHLEPSLVAMMGAGLLVLISGLKPAEFAMDVEWGTLVFFAGLFIMVGSLVNVGALAFGADFGGNLTIIGASANVVAIGMALPYVLFDYF